MEGDIVNVFSGQCLNSALMLQVVLVKTQETRYK